mmetsp:Transcript_4241/g.10798  ORF Transcript_4241/g.10798 Transcript_4241/m.10798 type:complete len:334 (-) Transcript_4241:178-1179(-)
MEVIQKAAHTLFGTESPPPPSVKELNIYPIKSCAEIRVKSATVTPRGFENDRVLQVVSNVDGTWNLCTPRDRAFEKLFHIQPTFVDGGDSLQLSSPHASKVTVGLRGGGASKKITASTMGRSEHPLEDYGDDVADWLEGATGIDNNPRLVGIGENNNGYQRCVEINPDQGEQLPALDDSSPIPVSLADEAPFLLTTQESLADLNRRLESRGKDAVDMRRFRPNIVIGGLRPWEEDSLKRIKIGSVEFAVWQRCGRCTMTTIDRDTLKRCGEPLSTLSAFRERDNGQRNFGVHLIPVCGGGDDEEKEVSLGNEIKILEYDEVRREEWRRLFGTP